MPPTVKLVAPTAPAKKPEYVMPRPPAVVVWRNAPGGGTSYAVVTHYGKHAIDLMIFPPDSRIGVPKSGVRFVDDPWNVKNGVNADSGVWEYTEETKQLQALVAIRADEVDARVAR